MKRNQKVQAENIRKQKFAAPFHELQALNENQQILLDFLKTETLVVAAGSAGTGKTLLACWYAAKQLKLKNKRKIILIRAYQPLAGRGIGFLPGDIKEKLYPYYQQMLDYLEDYLGSSVVEIALKQGDIEICSLETIRGRSWDDACIIVDEGQSLFIPEVQALVTRVGKNSQLIICGDNTGCQSDVPNQMDGLTYLDEICYKYDIPCGFVYFTKEDIVRSDMTGDFVKAFEAEMETYSPIIEKEDIYKQFKTFRS